MRIFAHMRRSGWANICIFVLLSLLTASCIEPETVEKPFYVKSFSVSGVITDPSGDPLRNIAVTMQAYDQDDKTMSDEKYYAITSTLDDGSYQFNVVWEDNAAQYFFVFHVQDPAGVYAGVTREMYLSSGSQFYSEVKKSYDVTGNDFSLIPKSK